MPSTKQIALFLTLAASSVLAVPLQVQIPGATNAVATTDASTAQPAPEAAPVPATPATPSTASGKHGHGRHSKHGNLRHGRHGRQSKHAHRHGRHGRHGMKRVHKHKHAAAASPAAGSAPASPAPVSPALSARSWSSFENTVENDYNKAQPYVQTAGNVIAGAAQVANDLAPYLKDRQSMDEEDLDERDLASVGKTVKKDLKAAVPYVKAAAKIAKVVGKD
ncbi:hypothetical protein CALCODRAFT_486303, partial [Calocera cornea HHB12733]